MKTWPFLMHLAWVKRMRLRVALVDTGCSNHSQVKVPFQYWGEKEVDMLTVNRNNFKCCRVGNIKLGVDDIALQHVKVLVVNGQLLFFDMLLGIDTIIKPGELIIMESGNVCSPKHEMSLWTVIKTDMEFDQIPKNVKEGYECKLQAWLHNGWFQPYPKKKLDKWAVSAIVKAIVDAVQHLHILIWYIHWWKCNLNRLCETALG